MENEIFDYYANSLHYYIKSTAARFYGQPKICKLVVTIRPLLHIITTH